MKLTICILALASLQLVAGDFCAVRLEVRRPDGSLVPKAEVHLLDNQGRKLQVKQLLAGRVNFCDLGFGRHAIVVAPDQCNALIIREVEPIFFLSQTLHGVLNDCVRVEGFRNACELRMRIHDEAGTPVRGAKLLHKETGKPYSASPTWGSSDAYGWLTHLVSPRTRTVLLLSKRGYESKEVVLECRSIENINIDVMLKPIP